MKSIKLEFNEPFEIIISKKIDVGGKKSIMFKEKMKLAIEVEKISISSDRKTPMIPTYKINLLSNGNYKIV